MLQVRVEQASEQRRQRAPHLAKVLQKLSVKRFSATSCNRLGTPGEGLRISEAIRLDDADVDHAGNLLQVRDSKFGKSRLVPLHPTTVGALAGYQRSRDQWHPAPHDPALFISPAGTRLRYRNVLDTFTTLVAVAELTSRPGRCRPRIHDLRHSLAVTTLLAWYADGDDVQARLPLLSTFLGHADPASTYWYLSASPELMAAAGARLDGYLAGR